MQVIIKDLNKDNDSSLGMTVYGNVLYLPESKIYENVELIYHKSYDIIYSIRAERTGIPDYTYYEFTVVNLDFKSVVYRKSNSSSNLFVKNIKAGNIIPGDKIIVNGIMLDDTILNRTKYDLVIDRIIKFTKEESCK